MGGVAVRLGGNVGLYTREWPHSGETEVDSSRAGEKRVQTGRLW